jgi:hypothetical protein
MITTCIEWLKTKIAANKLYGFMNTKDNFILITRPRNLIYIPL